MEKDQFILLLSKKLSKEISESELENLDQAFKNEDYQQLANQIELYFAENKEVDVIEPLEATWHKIAEAEKGTLVNSFDFSAQQRSWFASGLLSVAAMLAIVFGIGLIGYYLSNRSRTILLTTADQKVFKILKDGTRIWLNKQSTIIYNEDFGKQQREITLKGEAYFDVVENTAVPLIIHAGDDIRGIDIEVKGTAFNVNAYQENRNIAVALVRGAITVTDRRDTKNSVLLSPNDKLMFAGQSNLPHQHAFKVIALQAELIRKDISWVADTLVFHKERLINLVPKLAKKYDVKIEIRSDKLKEKRFSGTFVNETIYQVLEALKLSYPLTYTIEKQLVIIKD